jgi:hypothetical protein
MESDRIHTLLIKYIFLLAGSVIALTGLAGFLIPNSISVNGVNRPLSVNELVISLLIGAVLFVIHILWTRKVAKVKINQNKILIDDFKNEFEINWTDVESLIRYQYVYPPLYKITIKQEKGSYLFITKPTYISVSGFIADLSDMGNLIKKKKQELKI